MKIVVSDYAASPESGGTFSVLEDFYNEVLNNDHENEWIFILSGKYFQTSDNVQIIVRQDLKKNRIKKLFFELGTGHAFINKLQPDVFISLQNICTVGINSKVKIVYLHQAIPFFQKQIFRFWKRTERSVAFYQRLVGKVIKYSLSKEKPFTIVQTNWMKDAVISQTSLQSDNVIKASPVVPRVDDGRLFNNASRAFFYPATGYVYKNHKLILDAVKILNERGVDQFTVDLTLRRSQLEVSSSNVNLLGFIPRKKVLEMYENHVLIFPSYIESYGLPLLEAAQKADLILASDIEVTHEVLRGYHNVQYFDYQNPKELAHLMNAVLEGKLKSDSHPIRLLRSHESLLETVQKIIRSTHLSEEN